MYNKQFKSENFVMGEHTPYVENTIIDCLNKASTTELMSISENFPSLSTEVAETMDLLGTYNNFLGLNIGNSPMDLIKEGWANGSWLLILGAISVPLLSAVTQWINSKLMPQPDRGDDRNRSEQESAMASSMKTMNKVMPIMSAWFCFTMPSGMGIYWIAGAVVRGIQQVAVNKFMDRMDFDQIIQKNSEKSAKKLEKMQETQERLNAYANMNTKNIQKKANVSTGLTEEEKKAAMDKATEYYNSKAAKPGSMMSKANMVRDFNERNNKSGK